MLRLTAAQLSTRLQKSTAAGLLTMSPIEGVGSVPREVLSGASADTPALWIQVFLIWKAWVERLVKLSCLS